jgi:DNA-directed RNA polymerase subunit M/transcription elongation factor TFIIS
MEDLPSVCIENRLEWISLLSDLLHKKTDHPYIYAREIEHFIHLNRQITKIIGDDVKVFRYGDVDVLDLDNVETHENAANSNYTDLLRRAAWAIESTKTVTDNAQTFLEKSDSSFIIGTKHEQTEHIFYEKLDRARGVMNDKGSRPTKGIFSCVKCKSFDVDTEQKQTRSADEPMTIFCTCNVCGQRFVR